MSAGIGFYEAGLAAAVPAARVLAGQAPGGIPMANVAVVKRGINFAVARQIGYQIPTELVDSADVFAHLDEFLSRPARVAWVPLADREANRKVVLALVEGLGAAGLRQGEDFRLLSLDRNTTLVPDLTVGFNLGSASASDKRTLPRLSLPASADLPGEARRSAIRVARLLVGGARSAGPPAGYGRHSSRGPTA